MSPPASDARGRIDAGNGQGEAEEKLAQADDVREIAPGAVVRVPVEDNSGGGFAINNSLIVGLTILAFLLLSIIIWYIQEKKERLGDKVVSLFREAEEDVSKSIPVEVKKNAVPPAEENKNPSDLPPPPPPVF